MFDWVLNTPLLFSVNRKKGIAFWEAVLRHPALYNKSCSDNQRKVIGRNLLVYRCCGARIRMGHDWINKISTNIYFEAINFITVKRRLASTVDASEALFKNALVFHYLLFLFCFE